MSATRMSWQQTAPMTGATNRSHSRRWVSACLRDHGLPAGCRSGHRYQAIRSAPGRSRFGASAAQPLGHLRQLGRQLVLGHRLALPPPPVLVPHRPPPVPLPLRRVHRDPALQLHHHTVCRLAGHVREQSRCFLAVAGGAYLPGYAARRRCPMRGVRFRRSLGGADRLLRALEAKGGCVRVLPHWPTTGSSATRPERFGESRAMVSSYAAVRPSRIARGCPRC